MHRPVLFLWFLALAIVSLCSGCAAETVAGDTATYKFAWWVLPVAGLGSITLTGFGAAVIWEQELLRFKLVGVAMVLFGLLFLLGFTPRVLFVHVTVDESHVERG